ncbi:MAG TPA: single-stranded DNA-binding protein [Chloroflexi bacterium]|jgi:single-strand DNA-binding protein|nr:single-stranded DNA-binding protein [Chloroflexota bacterium]
MYQKLIIIGRLGHDPEMRYTPDGTPVTSFSVATDRRWTDANGQQQSRTVWFRVTAWRRLAETCNQYLTKGRLVMVEGELTEPRPYQSRDGEWRASLDVTANAVKFLGGRGDTGGSGFGEDVAAGGPETLDEEEIPF